MRAKVLNESGERVFAVIFDIDEDPIAGLTRFDWEKKDYERIPVREQTEVLALIGDIAVEGENTKKVHAHVVLGRRDGAATSPQAGSRSSASAPSGARPRRSPRP